MKQKDIFDKNTGTKVHFPIEEELVCYKIYTIMKITYPDTVTTHYKGHILMYGKVTLLINLQIILQ